MKRVWRFLREVRAELAKVVWPTRQRALRLTVIVIIVTVLFGAFIAAVDFGLGKGIEYVLDRAQKTPAPAASAAVPGTEQLPAAAQPAPVTTP